MAEMEFEAIDISDLILRCREVCADDKIAPLTEQLNIHEITLHRFL